jgi:hypothetical protein
MPFAAARNTGQSHAHFQMKRPIPWQPPAEDLGQLFQVCFGSLADVGPLARPTQTSMSATGQGQTLAG